MLLSTRCRLVVSLLPRQTTACLAHSFAESSEEYVDVPNYPPILDTKEEAVSQREKEQWHSKITRLGTYEQKLVELNLPKAYGYWSCILDDSLYQVNGIQFLKYVTRTAVTEGLPQHYYTEVSGPSTEAAERLAPVVERCIRQHFHHRDSNCSLESAGRQLVGDLHQLLSTCLPYAAHAKCSPEPRMNAWWLVGGLHNPGTERRNWNHLDQERKDHKLMVRNLWFDEEEPFMGDRCMSSSTTPFMVVRERHGLPPVEGIILDESERSSLQVMAEEQDKLIRIEEKKQTTAADEAATAAEAEAVDDSMQPDRQHPEVYGYEQDHRPVVLMPGYYPEEPRKYGRLFIHDRSTVANHEGRRPEYLGSTQLVTGHQSAEGGQGAPSRPLLHKLLIAAHTQGLAHAAMLGFGPVTELSYPLVQQSVVTDGQHWNIAVHQLNTIALHTDNASQNDAVNRLWVTKNSQLWESIDASTGRVLGLNKQLLTSLAALYLKETRQRRRETPHLAHYKHLWRHPASPYYRRLFREKSLIFSSGRQWLVRKPEIDAYELIYRLEFDTMPRLKNNKKFYDGHRTKLLPQDRTCQMYCPEHIPVHSRPLGKKDPLKREPMISPQTLFTKEYKKFNNFGYRSRYQALVPYRKKFGPAVIDE